MKEIGSKKEGKEADIKKEIRKERRCKKRSKHRGEGFRK